MNKQAVKIYSDGGQIWVEVEFNYYPGAKAISTMYADNSCDAEPEVFEIERVSIGDIELSTNKEQEREIVEALMRLECEV